MELSVHVEGNINLTWPLWKRHVSDTERLGYAGLFRCDHFTVEEPEYTDVLELIVSLTYAANQTERIHFGSLVAPLSFRDPVLLAFQAAALDDLGGGRMVLGIGTGWMAREHTMFGYELGELPLRFARFEEGLEVITRLFHSEEPQTYSGSFYQLRDAVLRPLPRRVGGPPILIGGGGPRRTLPLVARYASIWNANHIMPEDFRERSARLDEMVVQAGRQPSDIKRTLLVPVICGRTDGDLERSAGWYRSIAPAGKDLPLANLLDALRHDLCAIVGSPDEVVRQMRAYDDAGVEEIMMQFYDVTDFESVHLIAREVLPHMS
ncbi:MAG: LLM class F420-dependent oxidoreductase [Chloroflexota bacterium]